MGTKKSYLQLYILPFHFSLLQVPFSVLLKILCTIILKRCRRVLHTDGLCLIYSRHFGAFRLQPQILVGKFAFLLISLGWISPSVTSVSEVCMFEGLTLHPPAYTALLLEQAAPIPAPLLYGKLHSVLWN